MLADSAKLLGLVDTMGSSLHDDKVLDVNAYVQDTPELDTNEYGDIDAVAERKLVRRIDLTVLPLGMCAPPDLREEAIALMLVTLVYWVSFLDRSNIANARTAGLEASIGLAGYDFNIGACLYYVVYLICEPFAGLLIKRYGFVLVPVS